MTVKRDRMNLEELMNDLFVDEPITVILRNGVRVKGTVHSRHRKIKSTEIPATTILEGKGIASTIPDTDIERVVVEDVEWRRPGT